MSSRAHECLVRKPATSGRFPHSPFFRLANGSRPSATCETTVARLLETTVHKSHALGTKVLTVRNILFSADSSPRLSSCSKSSRRKIFCAFSCRNLRWRLLGATTYSAPRLHGARLTTTSPSVLCFGDSALWNVVAIPPPAAKRLEESCGVCVPVRLGLHEVEQRLLIRLLRA